MSETCPWEQYPLHELEARGIATLGRGNIISKKDIQSNPGGYPIYSSSAKGEGLFGNYGDYMFDEEMITWSVDGGGNLFYRPRHRFSVTNVSGYMRLDTSVLDYRFAHAALALQHSKLTFDYQTKAHPSVIRNLYHLPIPPLPEQKKIAEILSGIDILIALANKKMISEQHLRAGLLKEIIREDGPFLKLDSVSTRVSGHTPSKANPEYWDGGIPWISLSDTAKLDRRYISSTAKEISDQGIQNSSAVLHPAGLVVLSRDARVGCSAITTKKMAVSQHFVGWICSEQLLNRYLYYLLQKWKNKFEAIAMGSTIPTIGVPFFRDLEIPVPPVSEQRKIADTIESVDHHIEELRQRIYCLQNLKSAVASDLLSGRKRVSV